MTDYTDFSPKERFAAVDRMASQLFGTDRWKTKFATRYGLTRQAIGQWADNGAPLWACVALEDALAARNWTQVRAAVLAEINDADAAGCPPA